MAEQLLDQIRDVVEGQIVRSCPLGIQLSVFMN